MRSLVIGTALVRLLDHGTISHLSIQRVHIMRQRAFVSAMTTVLAVAPLSAQAPGSWQTIGIPSNSNTGAYWNNTSNDNPNASTVCNAGNILTNSAGSTAGCLNQTPSSWLPTATGLTPNSVYLASAGTPGAQPGAFRFTCNASTTCVFNGLGLLEGVPSTWGIVTDAGVSMNGVNGMTVAGGTTFSVWIRQSLPSSGLGTYFTSAMNQFATAPGPIMAPNTTNQQFATFTNAVGVGSAQVSQDAFGNSISILANQTFFVAMEDNVCGGRGFAPVPPGCGPVSDRDYNDIFISITATTVPEPATFGLLSVGLLALAGVAKRRKA
jgi:hypothetical protein